MKGLLSLAGGVIGGGLQYLGQRQANKTNLKIAREARIYDRKMWEKQNEYNSPEQQMMRLKDAGLNPNLAYGSGSVSGNTTGSAPRSPVPTVQSETSGIDPLKWVQSGLGEYMNIRKNAEEVDLIRANRILAERKAQTETVNSLLKTTLVDMNKARTPLFQKQGSLMDTQIEIGGKKLSLMDVEKRIGEARLPILINEGKISGVRSKYAERMSDTELQNLQLLTKLRGQQLGINETKWQGLGLDNTIKGLQLQMDSDLKKYNMTKNDNALIRLVLSADRNFKLSEKFQKNPLFGFKNKGTIHAYRSNEW